MKLLHYLRRMSRSVPVEMGLLFSLASMAAALVTFIRDGEFTPTAMLKFAPSLIFTFFILVSWKPMVARAKAVSRARMENDASGAMIERAVELRDLMLTQKSMLQAAKSVEAQGNAHRALQQTVTELEGLIEVLEPRRELVSEALAEADAWSARLPHRRVLAWARRSLVGGLTGLAVAVAGERGARLRDTWMADLAGVPEEGLTLSRWQQVGHATGFVIAAVRIRSRALSEPLWRPADWLLESESRTRTLITLAVGAQVIYIQKCDGLHGLLTEGWGWCGGCAVALHFFFRWLRKVRGIELAVTVQNSDETYE
ncbi:hypothetical protein ACOT81_28100 [Streptomyces sp. WI04-05B]|uniref:hypothetical protein n=1 Tax=Streptomyces TaxID=1883 RepID=UPI0029B3C892|nr:MULTISPECIES: hypothetical protein [unclassified Streptomyces]MDX2546806.1 hypothetical protein [Streptomyces sp. WI04-05B]MDX2589602.1 hypothetical protein [Streptomyces sp. WI04-05A]